MVRPFLSRIGLIASVAAATAAHALPNIVYILADDLGIGDVSGFNPSSKVATPAMDEVMKEGMRFTDAHSNSSVCTPTRYGVLTGRYAWRTPLKSGVLNGKSPRLIESGRLTAASLLRQKGYATACIGKWHLGMDWADTGDWSKGFTNGPRSVGFDYFYGIAASLDMNEYAYLENNRCVKDPTGTIAGSALPAFWRGGRIAPGFKHAEVLPVIADKAVAWLQERSLDPGKPFFLYLPLPSPHTPHVPNASFTGKSKAGTRGDYVAETDWAVDRVLRALDSLGLADRTLLIVTSDNGAHDNTYKQYGHTPHMQYRGEKADIFEAGHRVPFMIRWPGVVKPNTASGETICLTDFMATAAAIAGIKLPDDAGEDSYSILPVLLGQKPNGTLREATVHHSINGTFAIRQGDWKLALDNLGSGGFTDPEVVKGPGTLFDLGRNPGEDSLQDLYADRPEVVKSLRALLAKYKADDRSTPLPRKDAYWQDPTALAKGAPRAATLRAQAHGGGLRISGAGSGGILAVIRALDGRAIWSGSASAREGTAELKTAPLRNGLYILEASGAGWSGRTLLLMD